MKGDQDGEDPEAAQEREEQRLSRESRSDLQVFLLNRHFISESVLSEEHKDAIWKLVKEKGRSVREVSNMLGVDMNRVGAVVRLKGVEMEWKKQVSHEPYSPQVSRLHDALHNFDLVFKTSTWFQYAFCLIRPHLLIFVKHYCPRPLLTAVS